MEGAVVGRHPGGDVIRGHEIGLRAAVVGGPPGGVRLDGAGGIAVPGDGPHREDLPGVGRGGEGAFRHVGRDLLVDGVELQAPRAPRGTLDLDGVGARGRCGVVDHLGGLLGPGLGLGGGGDEASVRAVKVEVVIVGGGGPAVPGEVNEDRVAGTGREGDPGVEPAVGIGVGKGPLPVAQGLVPRCLNPEDPRLGRAAHYIPQDAGPVVEVEVVPAEGVVDDVHAL